jgi:hypothetical protein
MNESQVVRSKQSCDECGSSDAKYYYDDGHSHCYSCNTTKQNDGESTMSTYVTVTGSGELDRLVAKWSASKGSAIPERSTASRRSSSASTPIRRGRMQWQRRLMYSLASYAS